MKLKFTKMHGAGNDFVLIDDREGTVPWEDHFLMAALAGRRTGIGCEGVILVQQSDKAAEFMNGIMPLTQEELNAARSNNRPQPQDYLQKQPNVVQAEPMQAPPQTVDSRPVEMPRVQEGPNPWGNV